MNTITNMNVLKLNQTPKRGNLDTLKRRVPKMHKRPKNGGKNHGRNK